MQATTTPGRARRRLMLRVGGRLAGLAAAAYGGLCCLGCLCADRVIFQPPAASYRDAAETLKVPMSDGVRLSAVHMANPEARFTLLYTHGNAEDLGQIHSELTSLRAHGFAVFAYDYRGYGTSEGRASEKNCHADADAIYEYLVDRLRVPPERIIAYGRSLGGAMATYTASRHRVAGLILESSFVSAFRVATRVPLLPFDEFRNIDRIGQVHCPVLIMHGRQDEVVSFWHGEALYRAAREPKMCLWVDRGHHNDLMQTAGGEYWDALARAGQMMAGG